MTPQRLLKALDRLRRSPPAPTDRCWGGPL